MNVRVGIVLVGLLIALQWLFLTHSNIDLAITDWFYDEFDGFYLRDNFWVQLSYQLFRDLPYVLVPLLLWLLFASWLWRRKGEVQLRRGLIFLLVAGLLGPGLLVNEVLKAESGRARPHTVEAFGGDKTFTPAFVHADQCAKNCSFVSGHAAFAFFFLSLAWIFGDRRWWAIGIGLGLAAGLGRIVQGAHFFSDVIFALPVVFAVSLLSARLILGYWLPRSPGQD